MLQLLQKLKTRVVKKDVNPVWDEDLTLSVSDPNLPVKLVSTMRFHIEHVTGNNCCFCFCIWSYMCPYVCDFARCYGNSVVIDLLFEELFHAPPRKN